MSAAEYGEHFERKEVALKPATLPSRKSALSLKLEEFDQTVNNPFMEFAKFDGRVSIQFDRIPLRAFWKLVFIDTVVRENQAPYKIFKLLLQILANVDNFFCTGSVPSLSNAYICNWRILMKQGASLG